MAVATKTRTHAIADNVTSEVRDGKLHLAIDLEAKGKTSKSGKMRLLASTMWVKIPDAEGIIMSLNCGYKID